MKLKSRVKHINNLFKILLYMAIKLPLAHSLSMAVGFLKKIAKRNEIIAPKELNTLNKLFLFLRMNFNSKITLIF